MCCRGISLSSLVTHTHTHTDWGGSMKLVSEKQRDCVAAVQFILSYFFSECIDQMLNIKNISLLACEQHQLSVISHKIQTLPSSQTCHSNS